MSKPNSILNYFQKTPKATTSKDESSDVSGSASRRASEDSKSNGVSKTPTGRAKANKSTPQSLGNEKLNGSSRRRPALFESPRAAKKAKIEDEDDEDVLPVKTKSPHQKTSASNGTGRPQRNCKRRARFEDESSEDERLITIDSDSGDEYKPAESSASDAGEDDLPEAESEELSEIEEEDEDEEETPKSRRSKSTPRSRSKPKSIPSSRRKKKGSESPSMNDNSNDQPVGDEEEENSVAPEEERKWPHLTYDFLQKENIRDRKGRRPSSPEYDPTTLYVPPSFLNQVTPGHRQWWELKSKYYDVIFFFKVGKFYELYHMDAVIAKDICGLTYMRGGYAHTGFPEIGYKKFSDLLVQNNYKVARIEQMETPDEMEKRIRSERAKGKKITKFDRVIERKVCRVTTAGTRVGSVIDPEPKTFNSQYLFAIAEKNLERNSEFGVCFVDTSLGEFWIGQFEDDANASRLKTLLNSRRISEFLLEATEYSSQFKEILTLFPDVRREQFKAKIFPSSEDAVKLLENGNYFDNEWPTLLEKLKKNANSYDLALKVLGGIISYLKECLIDYRLITLKNFKEYIPQDLLKISAENSSTKILAKNLILDWTTLRNLEIFTNFEGESYGTLYSILNRCSTPFGKRLLREWLAAPSCDPQTIKDRLDASDQLGKNDPFIREPLQRIKKDLAKLPDMERLMPRIHNMAVDEKDHPENKANMFEATRYSGMKIKSFLATLEGFKIVVEIQHELEMLGGEFDSSLLKKITRLPPEGEFPDLNEFLLYFDEAFNHQEALRLGKIIPKPGVSQALDEANELIEEIKSKLESYRRQQEKELGIKINFKHGFGTNRYLLEVSEEFNKKIPPAYKLESTQKSKKLRRYSTDRSIELVKELIAAEARKDEAIDDQMRVIFSQFDSHYEELNRAIECLKVLDILLANVEFGRYLDGRGASKGRAEFIDSVAGEQILELTDVVNPVLIYDNSSTYIPNDLSLKAEVLLLTGPNMGGKSSLMRTIAINVILAQMGFYVPASSCRMTIVDRIFTRLGCRDEIFQNLSTFAVELKEAKIMLNDGARSAHSLILLDELGRGTSTHDGIAIAAGVLNELLSSKCCRVVFSTHYHSLASEFGSHPHVRLGHMACKVENIGDDDDIDNEKVTFLYKLVHGICPKSYGFNIAKLAGIPIQVVRHARNEANHLEERMNASKLIKTYLNSADQNINCDLEQLIEQAEQIVLR